MIDSGKVKVVVKSEGAVPPATLLTDKASMEGRISDAGLNAKKLPGCSKENWAALQKVVDALVPQSSEY